MPSISDEDYNLLQYIKQQNAQGLSAGQNEWVNNIRPDGSLAGAQVSAGPRPQQQQPSASQNIGGAVGNVGGMAAGHAVANQLTGSGAAASQSVPGMVPSWSASSGNLYPSSGYPLTESMMTESGAGSQMTPMTGSIATASDGAAAGGSGWLGATGASPYLAGAGYAAGAATGYEQGMGAYHAVKNEPMSLTEQAALALPTFGLSFAYNPLRKMFGSRKGPEQLDRDAVRKMLKEKGFVDDQYNIDLPNGQKFNIGKDGGEPWYNVDFSRPGIGGVVAAVQPLAAFITGGHSKLTRDFAGYLANAATAGGDPMENIMAMYQKTGMNHDQIYGAIHLMSQPGPNGEKPVLDQATADAYKNGLDQTFGVGAYAEKGPQFGTPPAAPQQQGVKPVQPVPTTPPQGSAGGAQQPTNKPVGEKPKSPFLGSALNQRSPGGPMRISPGIWADSKGQYLSKTGQRGK